jgi:hypothetical protein
MSEQTNTTATRQFVRHETRFPQSKWLLGLDLGQRRDHTAISVIDLSWLERGRCKVTYAWLFKPQLTLRGLERVPLGTSYETIHVIVAEKLKTLEARIVGETNSPAPSQELIVDAGGPGPPVVDRLRRTLKPSTRITPVMITSGEQENSLKDGYRGIPRRSLVTSLIQMISTRNLRCPPNLTGWREFKDEMLELSGERCQPARHDVHDDLVMSTALAAWAALRDTPELQPNAENVRRNEGGGLPYPF